MTDTPKSEWQEDDERAKTLLGRSKGPLFDGRVYEAEDVYPERSFYGRAWDGEVKIEVPVESEADVDFLRSRRSASELADRCVRNLMNQGLLRGAKGEERPRKSDSWYGEPQVTVEAGVARVTLSLALQLRDGDFNRLLHGPLDRRPWRTSGGQRLVLIGCVAKKGTAPAPAKDLYQSPLFAMRRAYAEAQGHPWAIVTAHHRKIVLPDTVMEPYDRVLTELTREELQFWQIDAGHSFYLAFGDLARGCTVEVHAGEPYVDALHEALSKRWGATLVAPLQGLYIGEQLGWYKARGFGRTPPVAGDPSPSANPDTSRLQAQDVSPRASGDTSAPPRAPRRPDQISLF